jgi:homogentisate 1,2-dioxygenase
MNALQYQSGFGNQFASEAVPGALPQGRNSPQQVALGLYAELLSGSAFTAPRHRQPPHLDVPPPARRGVHRHGLRTAAARRPGRPVPRWASTPPNPLRWHATPVPTDRPLDFIDGLHTVVVNGDADAQTGIAAHLVLANKSMERAFVNADGEMLIVPQQGALTITTELGMLRVAPGEVALLPRGWPSRWRWTGRRAPTSAKTTARRSACPNWGPSAATAWPTRATSWRRWRPSTPSPHPRRRPRSCANLAARCGARGCRPVPSTWWPGTATWCR